MKNANLIAMEFAALLPTEERPKRPKATKVSTTSQIWAAR